MSKVSITLINQAVDDYCLSKIGIKQICTKYRLAYCTLHTVLTKRGLIRTRSEAISLSNKGRKHSEETKNKISKSRKNYLKQNPEQVPYKLNHYSNGESYPETYFRKWLEQENISFQQEVNISIYRLDFVINKINLEIDGEQHYVDARISCSDQKRNDFIRSQGYEVIRIRWSVYKKLSLIEKTNFLINLKQRFESFLS